MIMTVYGIQSTNGAIMGPCIRDSISTYEREITSPNHRCEHCGAEDLIKCAEDMARRDAESAELYAAELAYYAAQEAEEAAQETATVETVRRALNFFPLTRELTDRETAMVEAYRRGEMIKAPSMAISPRFDREDYPMRGHAGRPSDRVTHFSRLINGNRFDFSRIIWGDGGTTFRVHDGGTMNVLHEWTV